MPARILPPVGMRVGPCPSSVGSAGDAPLIVTTPLVMLRLLCNARRLASAASRMKHGLQVLALLTASLACPSLVKSKGGAFLAHLSLCDPGGVFSFSAS